MNSARQIDVRSYVAHHHWCGDHVVFGHVPLCQFPMKVRTIFPAESWTTQLGNLIGIVAPKMNQSNSCWHTPSLSNEQIIQTTGHGDQTITIWQFCGMIGVLTQTTLNVPLRISNHGAYSE